MAAASVWCLLALVASLLVALEPSGGFAAAESSPVRVVRRQKEVEISPGGSLAAGRARLRHRTMVEELPLQSGDQERNKGRRSADGKTILRPCGDGLCATSAKTGSDSAGSEVSDEWRQNSDAGGDAGQLPPPPPPDQDERELVDAPLHNNMRQEEAFTQPMQRVPRRAHAVPPDPEYAPYYPPQARQNEASSRAATVAPQQRTLSQEEHSQTPMANLSKHDKAKHTVASASADDETHAAHASKDIRSQGSQHARRQSPEIVASAGSESSSDDEEAHASIIPERTRTPHFTKGDDSEVASSNGDANRAFEGARVHTGRQRQHPRASKSGRSKLHRARRVSNDGIVQKLDDTRHSSSATARQDVFSKPPDRSRHTSRRAALKIGQKDRRHRARSHPARSISKLGQKDRRHRGRSQSALSDSEASGDDLLNQNVGGRRHASRMSQKPAVAHRTRQGSSRHVNARHARRTQDLLDGDVPREPADQNVRDLPIRPPSRPQPAEDLMDGETATTLSTIARGRRGENAGGEAQDEGSSESASDNHHPAKWFGVAFSSRADENSGEVRDDVSSDSPSDDTHADVLGPLPPRRRNAQAVAETVREDSRSGFAASQRLGASQQHLDRIARTGHAARGKELAHGVEAEFPPSKSHAKKIGHGKLHVHGSGDRHGGHLQVLRLNGAAGAAKSKAASEDASDGRDDAVRHVEDDEVIKEETVALGRHHRRDSTAHKHRHRKNVAGRKSGHAREHKVQDRSTPAHRSVDEVLAAHQQHVISSDSVAVAASDAGSSSKQARVRESGSGRDDHASSETQASAVKSQAQTEGVTDAIVVDDTVPSFRSRQAKPAYSDVHKENRRDDDSHDASFNYAPQYEAPRHKESRGEDRVSGAASIDGPAPHSEMTAEDAQRLGQKIAAGSRKSVRFAGATPAATAAPEAVKAAAAAKESAADANFDAKAAAAVSAPAGDASMSGTGVSIVKAGASAPRKHARSKMAIGEPTFTAATAGIASTDSAKVISEEDSDIKIGLKPWLQKGTPAPEHFVSSGEHDDGRSLRPPRMFASVSSSSSEHSPSARGSPKNGFQPFAVHGQKYRAAQANAVGNSVDEGNVMRSLAATGAVNVAADADGTEADIATKLSENEAINANKMQYPPRNRPQLEQYLRLSREMERIDLMGGISENGARSAYKNLYANWTHTNYNVKERYLSGVRVRVIGNQLFYSPEPPELRQLATKQPLVFEHMFSIVAAHVLSFITRTMSMYKLPNADFTVAFGDFCLGTTRLFHDAWGSVARKDVDTSEPPAAPGAGLSESEDAPEPDGPPDVGITEAFQVPVFQWTNTQSGRKACNVVTTSTYDWNWWGSNFTQGSPWRLDAHPPSHWKSRVGKLFWRGLLISQDTIRARALRLALRHPDLLDVKAVDMDCAKFVVDLQRFSDHNTQADCRASFGNFTPMEQQQRFKYTLDMDGGGTTFRYKNLLLSGFLVFKVDSDTSQFWFESLQPFVHYIPVSRENFEQDLVRKLRWAMDHDADAERIAANAHKFAVEHLGDSDAHWQQQAAISMYASKQNFIPVGPDPEMERFCCKDAVNVNIMRGVKLLGLSSDCVDTDPACAGESAPKELLFSGTGNSDKAVSATAPPSSDELVLVDMSTLEHLARDLNTTKDVLLTVQNGSKGVNKHLLPQLDALQTWKDFAEVIRPFNLLEGHIMRDSSQAAAFAKYAQDPRVKTICETGFNAGHSALLFLLSNPRAHVYSFDLATYPYTMPAVAFLSRKFPDRFHFIKGDSKKTMPDFREKHPAVKCDLAVVDGGHVVPWVNTDALNFWHMAVGPQSLIIMNDTPCDISWCAGPSAAWHSMTAAGAIKEMSVVNINEFSGYSVGMFATAPSTDLLATKPMAWPTKPPHPLLSLTEQVPHSFLH